MIVREFTVHMLHERANNGREATVVQVGLLIADILSPHRRVYRGWRERKKRKISFPRVHYGATANCLLSVRRGQIFVASLWFSPWQKDEKREDFFSSHGTKRTLESLGPGVTDIPTGVILLYLNWASVPYAHIYTARRLVYMRTREQVNDGSEPPASPLHANLPSIFLSFFD